MCGPTGSVVRSQLQNSGHNVSPLLVRSTDSLSESHKIASHLHADIQALVFMSRTERKRVSSSQDRCRICPRSDSGVRDPLAKMV